MEQILQTMERLVANKEKMAAQAAANQDELREDMKSSQERWGPCYKDRNPAEKKKAPQEMAEACPEKPKAGL
jgi:hypothetical protein